MTSASAARSAATLTAGPASGFWTTPCSASSGAIKERSSPTGWPTCQGPTAHPGGVGQAAGDPGCSCPTVRAGYTESHGSASLTPTTTVPPPTSSHLTVEYLVLVLAVAGGARVLIGRDTKKSTTNAIGPKVSTLTPADPVLGPVVPGTTPKATVTPNNCQARRCHQAGRGDRPDVDQAPVSKPPAGKPQHCQGGGLLSCVSRVRSGRCLTPQRGSDER